MDLSPIFGLNSRFGAVWEGFTLSALGSLTFAEQLGLSKSTGGCGFSDLLEDGAPALPVVCRSGSLSHWLSCASVIVVTGWCDEKFQRRLVWGIPLVAFEKCPADNRNRGMCGSIAGHPSAIPLDFARGFGKTGQAFSKSVRSGAPPVG